MTNTRPTEDEVREVLRKTLEYQRLDGGSAIQNLLFPWARSNRAEVWLEKQVEEFRRYCWTCPNKRHPRDEDCPEAAR